MNIYGSSTCYSNYQAHNTTVSLIIDECETELALVVFLSLLCPVTTLRVHYFLLRNLICFHVYIMH